MSQDRQQEPDPATDVKPRSGWLWLLRPLGLIIGGGILIFLVILAAFVWLQGPGTLAEVSYSPSSGKTAVAARITQTATPRLPTQTPTWALGELMATSTVVPTAISTATPVVTATPTAIPQPAATFSPPRLLGPNQNASFGSRLDNIVLQWDLEQGLQDDKDWYYLYVSVPEAPQWNVHHFTKDKSYQIGAYLCGQFTKFVWYVVAWRQTGNEPKDGAPVGPQSETRTFYWTACRN